MITVDGYNLFYDTAHLLSQKPKTYQEIISRIEPLNCRLFYNIISSPDCRYERRFAEGRIKEHYRDMTAEERFQNIFNEAILYANPKSFFINKLKIKPSECEQIKSVSFTFCDYRDLPRHFEARGSEFGICFFHDFLQDRGVRPVIYLNESDPNEKRRILFNSPHLIEVRTAAYDMQWESEWRIKQDLPFEESDIAFVIVPQDRHEFYVEWFMEKEGFDSVQILTSNTYKSYVDHLIFYPQQSDNNWDQVEIFRSEYGRGLKITPEDYNAVTEEDKRTFSEKYRTELHCFAKNTILLNYEYAYTNRFLSFADKIASPEKLGELFQDYTLIKENIAEPEDAQRDLIMGLFQSLAMHTEIL